VPGGTLILLNTGLNTLLVRVALTLAAATVPFDRDAQRRVILPEKTDAQTALRETADAWLADAVLDYIHQRPCPASAPPDLPEAQLRIAEQAPRVRPPARRPPAPPARPGLPRPRV